MQEKEAKKEKSLNHVALTYFVTAIFAIPLIIVGALMLAIWLLAPGFFETLGQTYSPVVQITFGAISIGALYLGTMYGSRYVAEKYVIPDALAVVKRATIWLLFLTVFINFIEVISLFFPYPEYPFISLEFAISALFDIGSIAVIYFGGKKFLPKYLARNT